MEIESSPASTLDRLAVGKIGGFAAPMICAIIRAAEF
jgi:hypothetical protein